MTSALWTTFGTYIVMMLAITNPIGNMAIFLSLTSDRSLKEQRKIALTTAFAVVLILVIVTWSGQFILSLLGISISAFEIGGGLVITLLGLSMLSTKKSSMSHTEEEDQEAKSKTSVAVVPLAIPIIAGPGAITTILVSLKHYSEPIAKVYLTIGNCFIALVIALALYFGGNIGKMLGVSGINIVTRIMGLILVAIAMQMITSGLADTFPVLK